MAIDITKYVRIISGVGGASQVAERSFCGRIFTTNAALAANTQIEFTNALDVGTYFGATSEEYLRAALYFGWISKNTTQAKKIQFYGWDHTNDSLTVCMTKSAGASNDFGSFLFVDSLALTLAQVEELAVWNNTQNNMYIFCQEVTAANAATWSAALIGYAGLALTLFQTGEFHGMAPMIILAATNYQALNSVQNYMFQQFPTQTASVTDDTDSATYDALSVNYIGATQTAGQLIKFYQRGNLMGGATAPTAMNVYANEMWLKDAMSSSILNLLLSLAKVSANKQGVSQLTAIVNSNIKQAITNGTISIGKTLTAIQQVYITNLTGDPKAWQQVQNQGFYVTVSIESSVASSGVTEYNAVYSLVYSKDDDIRAVTGTHTLI